MSCPARLPVTNHLTISDKAQVHFQVGARAHLAHSLRKACLLANLSEQGRIEKPKVPRHCAGAHFRLATNIDAIPNERHCVFVVFAYFDCPHF